MEDTPAKIHLSDSFCMGTAGALTASAELEERVQSREHTFCTFATCTRMNDRQKDS